MNTKQLEDILTRDRYTRDSFLGVFPSDALPSERLARRPLSLIVNTHPHDRPGEHWLAIYLPDDEGAEFFDSYGFSPEAFSFPRTLLIS